MPLAATCAFGQKNICSIRRAIGHSITDGGIELLHYWWDNMRRRAWMETKLARKGARMFSYTDVSVDPDYDRDKMRNMILFFIEHGDRATLGKTKLMKLLYFADFDHFEEHDESITGATYRKLERGPVPPAAFRLLEDMAESGDITIEKEPVYNYLKDSFIANREFDPSFFTYDELATLQAVAERWKTTPKTQIVEASHLDAPWTAARNGDVIPYHLVYYRNTYGEMDIDDHDNVQEWG